MDGRQNFADALARFDAEGMRGPALIDAAARLLVEGCESPGVIDLACLPASGDVPSSEFDALVDAARDDLQMLPLDDDALDVRVAQAQARRWLNGIMSARHFAHWAWARFRYDDHRECLARLVQIDIEFECLDGTKLTEEEKEKEVNGMLADAVARLLEEPDPWA